MSTFLVTGAARGLGLALVRVLASLPRGQVSKVIATSRSAQPEPELSSLVESSGGLVIHIPLDVSDSSSINAAVPLVEAALEANQRTNNDGDDNEDAGRSGGGLDYLINNAAVRDPEWHADKACERMTCLEKAIAVNVTGTHEVILRFLPLLRRGRARKIVVFSSTLGCITTAHSEADLGAGPFPAYRISKAATHMLTVQWSNQLAAEGFCVYLQSPGNLKTELGGGDGADLDPEVGARETVRIAMEATPEDTGRHRNILVKGWENGGGVGGRYDGKDLHW